MRLKKLFDFLSTSWSCLFFAAPIAAQTTARPILPPLDPHSSIPMIIPTTTHVFIYPSPSASRQATISRPLIFRTIKRDVKEAERLTTVGDRFFRLRNYARATERYEHACVVDPRAVDPRVGLALIALEHDDFIEAAGRFREAEAADPGWLSRRPRDIEAIYSEPSRFADVIAKLETRVQTHPDDRDAWLILGAHLFLSNRLQKGSDVFLRLNDGKRDSTVAAFLAAIDERRLTDRNRLNSDEK